MPININFFLILRNFIIENNSEYAFLLIADI
jgi:hypothetical protein